MEKSVSNKMGLKEGMRAIRVNASSEKIPEITLPGVDMQLNQIGKFDYIHLFVKSQDQLHHEFPELMQYLNIDGMLWVSWPKSGKLNTDLNIKTVIKIGYNFGLVESKCLSINEIWSALKFTHPKKGKIYNNSYGKLND